MSIRRLVGMPEPRDDDQSPPLAASADLGNNATGDSRRQFVRKLGLGGAAGAIAIAVPSVVLAKAVSAQGTDTDAEALSAADTGVLTFLESLEGAAVLVYKRALQVPTLLVAEADLLQTYLRHHQAHVELLGTARGAKTGDPATPADQTVSDPLVAQVAAAGSDSKAIYQIFFDLESNLAATYLQAVDVVVDPAAAGVVAGIGPVDGQQAFQFGHDLGLPIDEYLPIFQTTTGAYPLPAA